MIELIGIFKLYRFIVIESIHFHILPRLNWLIWHESYTSLCLRGNCEICSMVSFLKPKKLKTIFLKNYFFNRVPTKILFYLDLFGYFSPVVCPLLFLLWEGPNYPSRSCDGPDGPKWPKLKKKKPSIYLISAFLATFFPTGLPTFLTLGGVTNRVEWK